MWSTLRKHQPTRSRKSTAKMDEQEPVVDAVVGEEQASIDAEADAAARAEQLQIIMDGLTRLERTVDESGFAFTALDAVEKSLASLDAVRTYAHLQFVDVSRNQIADAAPLGDLPYLVVANLAGNAISSAPSALTNPYLQALDLSQNQLTTLQGLANSSLSSLRASDNQLESLAGVGALPSLTSLDVARNAVESIAALASEVTASKLDQLDLSENKLTSLAGVEAFASLSSLNVRQNNLDSMEAIDKLWTLERLSSLDLSLNPLVDTDNYRLHMITWLPHLQSLDGEPITEDERLAAVALKQQRLADEAAAAAEADG